MSCRTKIMCDEYEFIRDDQWMTIYHITFNTCIKESDPYFEVYIDDIDVNVYIKSTASGKVRVVKIDLAKLDKHT